MTLGIELSRLTLQYKDTRALDEMSLRLDGGKIYGLLGRNGSGKTSLASVIAARSSSVVNRRSRTRTSSPRSA